MIKASLAHMDAMMTKIRGKILYLLAWMLCAGLLLFLITRLGMQMTTPAPAHHLLLSQDIPLPGSLPDAYRNTRQPLAPGVATLFDHFDFQALDAQRHLLFIAHTGPNPDREQEVNPRFNPDTDTQYDGNIVIFDTMQKKVVRLLNIPQVAGIVVAPDIHKVYAADANDNLVYSIDESTWKATPIHLQENDSPDTLEYDQRDKLIFVSNPGTPADPDQSQVIERKNQNETIIDARTDKVITRIILGVDGKWGDDVGIVKFDPGLHRIIVPVQQLPNPDDPNPNILPPAGTAKLVVIDPLTHRVLSRLALPYGCITPHGTAIDIEQHIAFIACVDADTPSLIRVDLRTLQVIAETPWPVESNPDMIVLDPSLHLVYVGCGAGISLYQENGRSLTWLANYSFGVSTHSIAVNQETHEIYLPITRVGGRPILRIMHYNPQGLL